MAKVEDFNLIANSSVLSDHMLYVVNENLDTDHKLQLNTLYPVINDQGSAGQAIHNGLTNITQINLKKLQVASTSSGAITIATHSDGHLLLTLVEGSLNLANCDNSSSGFLTTVNLASNVGATILPVPNGGTGASSLTAGGILLGSGTGAITAMAALAKGSLVVGDGATDPQALTVGTNGFFLVADSSQSLGVKWNQTLGVANGGTGANTFTANGVLIGNGTGAVTAVDLSAKGTVLVGDGSGNPQGLALGTNGYWLNVDTSTATGLAYQEKALANLTEWRMPSSTILDMNNNNIDLGTAYISDDSSTSEGLRITGANAYIGASSAYFDSDGLNLQKGIELGGASATAIKLRDASSTASTFLVRGQNSTGGNAGSITIEGGTSSGSNGDGGDVAISAGRAHGSGTDGSIHLLTDGVEAMEVRTDQHVKVNKSIIFNGATDGIVYTSMATATQSTDHSTTVPINGMAGVITLAAVALNSGAEAEFTVTNTAAQLNSLILLTVDSPPSVSSTDDSVIIAQVTGKAAGSFKIILKNVGDSNTDTTARKINFLIINPGV
tara:strand:- start:3008 stop:4672 length:1665 start_codon:yes stop_codon:yes gene_type:complete